MSHLAKRELPDGNTTMDCETEPCQNTTKKLNRKQNRKNPSKKITNTSINKTEKTSPASSTTESTHYIHNGTGKIQPKKKNKLQENKQVSLTNSVMLILQ